MHDDLLAILHSLQYLLPLLSHLSPKPNARKSVCPVMDLPKVSEVAERGKPAGSGIGAPAYPLENPGQRKTLDDLGLHKELSGLGIPDQVTWVQQGHNKHIR